jgi:hypothetical protein
MDHAGRFWIIQVNPTIHPRLTIFLHANNERNGSILISARAWGRVMIIDEPSADDEPSSFIRFHRLPVSPLSRFVRIVVDFDDRAGRRPSGPDHLRHLDLFLRQAFFRLAAACAPSATVLPAGATAFTFPQEGS